MTSMFEHGRETAHTGGKRRGRRGHKTHRRHHRRQRGGLFEGIGATLKTMIVPTVLYLAQKKQQRRTRKNRRH